MVCPSTVDPNLPAGHPDGGQIGSGLDAIGNHRVGNRPQAFHSLHGDSGTARPLHVGPHEV